VKLFIAVPEVIILGHKCNYKGRIPDDSKIAQIWDWPPCKTLTDIWAFLGTTSFMRIWIRNYSSIACPLVDLTHKGTTFIWQAQHEEAMQALKDAIIHLSALISIDYASSQSVYLAVDSSIQGVGWILSQNCANGKRRPALLGLISWNERESHYSQAKLELYSLFCILCTLCLYLVGIQHLIVEMDAQFICGMLNNPDIQPNATINRWIATILLFDFKLVHIPANKHQGPDSLLRCEPANGEEDDDDNPEAWIDQALCLGIWEATWSSMYQVQQCSTWLLGAEDFDTNAKVPTSSHATDNEEVAQLHQYLATMQLPPDLNDKAQAWLLWDAKHFFLADG
jgi:hypothetical protein